MTTTQQDGATLNIGGIDTAVAVKGNGPPLVYLHGAFGYRDWHPFLDKLAENFTVYAPLHPGFGENSTVDDIDDILDLTLYHYDLLDALNLDAPAVVGHFLGAMTAAEMAALRPGSVGKLVLAAPAGVWLDETPGADYYATPMDEMRAILFADPQSPAAKALLPEPADDLERGTQIIERVRSLATVGKFLWPIPDKGIKKRLSRITAPTLIIAGDQDKIVPLAHAQEFADRITGATTHILPAGHMLMLEEPAKFAAEITTFLQS